MVAARDAAERTAIAPDWIVCHGSARSMMDGVVTCPLGTFAPWADCIGCHSLEWAEDDRDCRRSCSTEPAPDAAGVGPTSPTTSWAELIIELL